MKNLYHIDPPEITASDWIYGAVFTAFGLPIFWLLISLCLAL